MNKIRINFQILMFSALMFPVERAAFAQTEHPVQVQAGAPQTSSVAAVSAEADPALPGSRLLRFSSTMPGDLNGVAGGPVALRFALYAGQQGGEALWAEMQQIEVARDGSYVALLGAGTPGGLPARVFSNGNARWLGVALGESDQSEQPRLLLVGVPYALEATNAQTLGGLPASAFLRASDLKAAAQAIPAITRDSTSTVTTSGGSTNRLPKFTSSDVLGNSAIYDVSGQVGIGISKPGATLDVDGTGLYHGSLSLLAQGTATTAAGYTSWPLNLSGSVFDSTTGAANLQTFQWQVAPFVNDKPEAQGYLALNFYSGTNAPKQILAINSIGQFLFAKGQLFPGVAALGAANTFTGAQTITGVNTGVNATATSATGVGVNATGGAYGVFSNATGATGVGVFGSGNWGVQGAGKAYGVYGSATSSGSAGVYGQGTQYGVYGSGGKFGLYGFTNGAAGTAGVYAVGSVGVQGSGTIYGVQGSSAAAGASGVFGNASGSNSYGVNGTGGKIGVYGSGGQYGLYGVTNQSAGTNGVYATGDVGVQGNGATYGLQGTGGTAGVYAAGAIGVQGSGSTYGVEGETTASGGAGVYGTGTGSSGAGVKGNGAEYGVYGNGGQFGLYGKTNQAPGTAGVYAIGSVGVQGSGTVYGVQGGSSASNGYGVYGSAPKFGVYGLASGGNNTVGVYGQGGYGMQAGGTQYGTWSQVKTGSNAVAGVRGIYGEPSASGQHSSVDICFSGCGKMFYEDATIQFQAGMWADTNYDGDNSSGGFYRPALMATADANIAGVFVNNSNVVPVLFVFNAGTGGGSTGTVITAQSPMGTCSFTSKGDTSCTGTLKSTVTATTPEGSGEVETYAVESAENWFEDAGSAQLVNGAAHINLEAIFGQTVNTGIEYHVFLTPNDDCKGLFVKNKTASGFEVHELGGGRSSIAFEYRIMAKRLGHEKERLARVISPTGKRRGDVAAASLKASE
jgi:hypothetical protein